MDVDAQCASRTLGYGNRALEWARDDTPFRACAHTTKSGQTASRQVAAIQDRFEDQSLLLVQAPEHEFFIDPEPGPCALLFGPDELFPDPHLLGAGIRDEARHIR